LKQALAKVIPSATAVSRFHRYDKVLSIKPAKGKMRQAPKVEIAKYIIENFGADYSRLDLQERLSTLIKFIRDSNPSYERVGA
jgi:hypothetical protein